MLWPLLRGVSLEELRIDLGLTIGEGWRKEIGAGLLGYFAGIPFVLIGSAITALILSALHTDPPPDEAKHFPMFQTPLSDSWIAVVFMGISTVIWAPFFEECFFRGALHRYLPSRLGIPVRVLITAAIFGAIHPYSAQGMIEVGLMGLVFGLLREWRGSLIPSMLAHALHNATITLVTIGFLWLLR